MSTISPELHLESVNVEYNTIEDDCIQSQMINIMLEEVPMLKPKSTCALPNREYIEATVLPLLLRGMEEVVKAKPADPIHFLASYLFINNPQRREHIPTAIICDESCRVNSSTYLEHLMDKLVHEFHPCGSNIDNNGVIDPEWLAAHTNTL